MEFYKMFVIRNPRANVEELRKDLFFKYSPEYRTECENRAAYMQKYMNKYEMMSSMLNAIKEAQYE